MEEYKLSNYTRENIKPQNITEIHRNLLLPRVSVNFYKSLSVSIFFFGLFFLAGCDFGLDAPYEDANGIYLDLLSNTQVNGDILLVQGDKAYVIYGQSITIFDISDKLNPELENYYPPLDEYINNAKIKGSYIYAVSEYDSKFIVINISSSSPKIVGELELEYEGKEVEIDGNYAYVRADNYLLTIDISSPTNPVLVNTIHFSSGLYDCIVENKVGYLYYRSKLTTYDFSDPTNPLKRFEMGYWSGHFLVKNKEYLYVKNKGFGEEVSRIDVTKIGSSKELKFIRWIEFPDDIIDFDFDGYGVASSNSTLYLLNIDDPSYPCVAEKVSGGGSSLTIKGDYIYYLKGSYFTILKVQKIK